MLDCTLSQQMRYAIHKADEPFVGTLRILRHHTANFISRIIYLINHREVYTNTKYDYVLHPLILWYLMLV